MPLEPELGSVDIAKLLIIKYKGEINRFAALINYMNLITGGL